MKNIEAGVDVIHIQEKKEEVGEQKNKVVMNIVRFYLKDDPRFEISAMGLWSENSRGEKVGYVDIYFFPSIAFRRFDDKWLYFHKRDEGAEKIHEKWNMLWERIEAFEDIFETIRQVKWVGL